MENLGQLLFNAGLKQTTWFDGSGQNKSTGVFNPSVRLFNDQGAEIPGALQQRMGMPAGLTDFQPGYGHAQRQALFAGIVQRALDAGWFARFGIPAGRHVDGATLATGWHPEFLQDVAYLLTGDRLTSEIITRFADVQQVFNGPPASLATSLTELFSKKKLKFPSRHTPLQFTPAELSAAGVAATEAGLDVYYDFCAQSLLQEIAAGKTVPEAGPADAGYSFATVDVPTFLRWRRQLQAAGSNQAGAAKAAAGSGVTSSKGNNGVETFSVNAEGLDREGLLALANDLLGKALGRA
jgi:hypothetical protein